MRERTGSGHPRRSLELLWREVRGEAERPAGRAGLTVGRIVAQAVRVADAEGVAALSMRRIAEDLGVGAMSLYTYVPGKAELIDLMYDQVLGEAIPPDTPDLGWRERLGRIARANHRLYQRHPWLLQVAVSRPPLGPNLNAKYEYELRAIDGIGLSDVEMDTVLALIADFVHGAVRGSVDATLAQAQTGVSDVQWFQAQAGYLEEVLDPELYPTAVRVGAAAGAVNQAATNPLAAFDFGLARILDGIEALLETRR